ncbi:MAG TPA: RDD family protein [Terriglobales bacterium]|nr:RDD family protein [Terriglobales bacterium]
MTCSICGNALPCTHSGRSTEQFEKEAEAAAPSLALARHAWRNEVISRVRQHRARRGKAINSMELDFPAPEWSCQEPWPAWQACEGQETGPENRPALSRAAPKIIRFPVAPFSRFPATEQPIEDEATVDPPRIMDAEPQGTDGLEQAAPETAPAQQSPPQQMELPCFDDIRLDSDTHKALDIIEPVPQAAPLGRRALAGAVDLALVLLASLVFKISFNRMAEDDPHTKAALLCALAVAGILWLLYQYLFLVHGTRTPGMAIADLELSTFCGQGVDKKGRRARALATAISAFSLGLGFAWALLDEDQLGWHDRMTGTVVREAAAKPGP